MRLFTARHLKHLARVVDPIAMAIPAHPQASRRVPRSLLGLMLAGLLTALAPATSNAAISTFGSPLSVPATRETANDLGYSGSNIALPGSIFHVPHDGADTALWNTRLAGGEPAAPASGQVLSVRLEGCAQQPSGAPAPLTQIHFQDLVPQPDGGAKVNVTTQPFQIPVCGQGGASGSTVTTYAPTNFCVAQGDYVDFNDEGGFVPSLTGPPPYPSGVPYMVIGAVAGSRMDSFIRNNGVGNGATFAPGDMTYHDGFASNQNDEVMLQATLGTGSDATPLCPGGTQGESQGGGSASRSVPATPVSIRPQTDGVNHSRIVAVAIFCRLSTECKGVATLTPTGRQASQASYGRTTFSLRGQRTAHVRIRVPSAVIGLLRRYRGGVRMTLSAVVRGKTVTQVIALKIF